MLALVVLNVATALAQRTISGNVTDEKGEALIGASILVKGTGTVTDAAGNYSLGLPANATTLVFSYTGFRTQEVAITNSDILDVVLQSDAIGLEDVVVVAYGTQSNRFKVQSIASIGAGISRPGAPRVVLPIPQREIDLGSALPQNPGY